MLSYNQLLSLVQSLDGFRWPNPMWGETSQKDRNRISEYHKDKGYTIEKCHHLHYQVERMVWASMLNKYLYGQTDLADAHQATSGVGTKPK